LSLDTIYELIREDLGKVEEKLLAVSDVDFDQLSEMLAYSLESGGKRVRPALTLLSGKFYKYDLDYLIPMSLAVELLHTATLVHDDAIDHSAVRRSRPTINTVWGEDKSVLLGDYLFARAGEFCASTGSVRVIRLFSQTLAIISSGELRQAFSAFKLEQTREQYLQKIASKTASLFVLSTESGAVLSQAPESSIEALVEYGYNLGIAFQIVDDILDFNSSETELGKPVASDLSQGTLTLPAMLLLERYPRNNPIKKLFQNQGETGNNIEHAVEMVRNSPVVAECYDIANEYRTKACQNLNRLPDSTSREVLRELADYIVRRKN
jgi:geranylgeranyl pyrophosphate synthase